MQYGHFDDARREYVIETPFTPRPWINYLGSDSFFGLISNTGGGYCFYRDAKLMRLLRYRYNNIPADIGGRFYYLKESDKAAWSPTYLPCGVSLDSYCCRHGLGYSAFEGEKDGLSAVLTCFVPLGETCEVHLLQLKNVSDTPKRLSVYGAVEWCLWNAVDDATNFQRGLNIGEVEIESNVVYHKTEYRERRNHYAYYGVNAETAGFDTDRDAFLGRGTWSNPVAVEEQTSYSSVAHGGSPIAALRLEISLEAGETAEYTFILGYSENQRDKKFTAPNVIRKDGALDTLKRFSPADAPKAALEKLRGRWEELLSAYRLESGDAALNRMVNTWNQYQCMTTFNISRSASYFESGIGRGMGFRDCCQDLLGFVHLIPARARERILDLAGVQFADGSTYHQYQPLTKRGNLDVGAGFNDDPLWLVACTSAYLRETGDWSILEERVPFVGEHGAGAPLMEHLRRSMHFSMAHLGPHGLPLIGHADWNDCLNLNCFSEEPGESFQTHASRESGIAESVFIAAMFVYYGREFVELCVRKHMHGEARKIRRATEKMRAAVESCGWDGEWFLRAYDALGGKVGSRECQEGQIYIEPQGFCVMAGIGVEDGKAAQALDSVHERLLGEYGVELLTPCYTTYHKELGEITSYPPGYKENGSVFCHNNPWVCIAETVISRGDRAFDIYRRISPAYLEEKSDVRKAEPYVYSQTVAARASHAEGEARNSWLTGTAAWSYVAISQAILGVIPTLDGLFISPCLPENFGEYTVYRRYCGADYCIRVRQTGFFTMSVNGKPVQGRLIPTGPEGQKYEVEVTV